MIEYVCTNCTHPTPTLYKVYSTPGSIQLTTCQSCKQDVDPYIEREWLLVLMDCILHRSEAFRHLLYNREPFCKFGKSEYRGLLLQMLTGAYLVRICLWYIELLGGSGNDKLQHDSDINGPVTVVIQMLIGDFVLITSTILTGIMMLRKSELVKDEYHLDSLFISRIYLAISIPNLFHAVTVTVSIWEKSFTTFMLGSLFVLSLQRMGVAIVMEERYSNRSTKTGRTEKMHQNCIISSYCLPQSFPLVIGTMICIVLQVSGIMHLKPFMSFHVPPIDSSLLFS